MESTSNSMCPGTWQKRRRRRSFSKTKFQRDTSGPLLSCSWQQHMQTKLLWQWLQGFVMQTFKTPLVCVKRKKDKKSMTKNFERRNIRPSPSCSHGERTIAGEALYYDHMSFPAKWYSYRRGPNSETWPIAHPSEWWDTHKHTSVYTLCIIKTPCKHSRKDKITQKEQLFVNLTKVQHIGCLHLLPYPQCPKTMKTLISCKHLSFRHPSKCLPKSIDGEFWPDFSELSSSFFLLVLFLLISCQTGSNRSIT